VLIGKTSDPELRRVEVTVRDQKNAAPLAELIAFKGRSGTDADTAVDQSKPGEGANTAAGAKATERNKSGQTRPAAKQ
jgi:hypothetical protein